MREWFRRYLGITTLRTDIVIEASNIRLRLVQIQKQLDTIVPGMGRVISKLDTMYAQSENPIDNPERKAASDKLAMETIARLEAEAAARAPYNITSEDDDIDA